MREQDLSLVLPLIFALKEQWIFSTIYPYRQVMPAAS